MNFYFSPSTLGFYRDDVFSVMPKDVVKLTKKQYNEAIGYGCIEPDADGMPKKAKAKSETKEDIQAQIAVLNEQVKALTEKLNDNN